MGIDKRIVALARSRNWDERAKAGRALALHAGDGEADMLLRRLLLDEEDTAVTLETAEALLHQRSAAGMALVASAVRSADETRSWLETAVHYECMQGWGELLAARRLVEHLARGHDDAQVRAGAVQLLRLLDTGHGEAARP